MKTPKRQAKNNTHDYLLCSSQACSAPREPLVRRLREIILFSPILWIAFSLLFSLLTACQFEPLQIIQPPPLPQEQGAVFLQITGMEERTILPVDNLTVADFEAYTLVFYEAGTTTVVDEIVRDNDDIFDLISLDTGEYDLLVTAYLTAGDPPTEPVASAFIEGIGITAGETETVSIELKAIVDSGLGKFSWDIGIPAEAETAKMTIKLTTETWASGIDYYFRGGTPGDDEIVNLKGELNLISGYYNVLFTITKPGASAIERREILHIYEGKTSNYAFEFKDEHFNMILITITAQPEATTNATLTQIASGLTLTTAATVTGGGSVSYQWYENDTNSNTGGTLIPGATNATFNIPTSLTTGSYYYYCVVSAAGAVSVSTNVAVVNVGLETLPADNVFDYTNSSKTYDGLGATANVGYKLPYTTTTAGTINVMYVLNNGSPDDATSTVTKAGLYDVYVTTNGGTVYGALGTKTKVGTYEITKATPTAVVWPTGLTAKAGDTLAQVTPAFTSGAAEATGVSGTIYGTFSWTDGGSTPVGAEGTQTHNVTFTPSDSDNYNTVPGTAQVTVNTVTVSYVYTITESGTDYNAEGGTLDPNDFPDTLTNVISKIGADADGADCTIRFGTGGTALNTGNTVITFNNTTGPWGDIKLEGSIVSIATYTIAVANDTNIESYISITNTSGGTINFSSTGNIEIKDGELIATANNVRAINYNSAGGNLTVSGGTISHNPSSGNFSGQGIYIQNSGTVNIISGAIINSVNGAAIYHGGTGTLTIEGGTISSTSGYTIHNGSSGGVVISGGLIQNNGSYEGYITIFNVNTGSITITGGEIKAATNAVTPAIAIQSTLNADSGIILGGDPTITGRIRPIAGKLSVLTTGNGAFNPSDTPTIKKFLLDFDSPQNNDVAVMNGKDFLANFELHEKPAFRLEPGEGTNANHLILIEESANTGFTLDYDTFNPTDAASGEFSGTIELNKSTGTPITVISPAGSTGVSWRMENVPLTTGNSVTLNPADFNVGEYTLYCNFTLNGKVWQGSVEVIVQ